MTIEAMITDGYKIQSWCIMTIRGERKIALHLTKKSGNRNYKYIAAAPVGDATLREAEFTIPILREGK